MRVVLSRELDATALHDARGGEVFQILGRRPQPSRKRRRRQRSRHRLGDLLPALDGAGGDLADIDVVLKTESFPFPIWLTTFLTRPSGAREQENLERAAELGAPVFSAVLRGELRWGPFFFRTVLATREIHEGINLSWWLKDPSWKAKREFPPERVRAALPELARIVASLHRQRFYCRTLLAKNILMADGGGREVRFVLHDMPRACHRPGTRLCPSRAAFDLACLDKWAHLWLARPARLTLLREYLDRLGEGPSERDWLRRIEHHRRRLLKRTPWSFATHWVRKHGKLVPGLGGWIR